MRLPAPGDVAIRMEPLAGWRWRLTLKGFAVAQSVKRPELE